MPLLKEKSHSTQIPERVILPAEKISKEAIFDCRMCGQCILHSTGLACPMRCPKNSRNGPCGGVRANGNCEVYPDKPCVWVHVMAYRQEERVAEIIHRTGLFPRLPPEVVRAQKNSTYAPLT